MVLGHLYICDPALFCQWVLRSESRFEVRAVVDESVVFVSPPLSCFFVDDVRKIQITARKFLSGDEHQDVYVIVWFAFNFESPDKKSF